MATGILTLIVASDVTRAQCPQQPPDVVWQKTTTPAGTCPTPSQCGTRGSPFYDPNISQNGEVLPRAVLIGVPSQTHHFDHGMVYVELLVGPPVGSG